VELTMASERRVEELVAHVMTLYERGIIRHEERVAMIGGLATRPGFFACLERLPIELVEGLQEMAFGAPAHPEDVFDGIGHVSPMTKEEFKTHQRQQRLHSYWVRRLLRMHFFPDRPLPPFEPRKRVGVVCDSTVVDGSVVLFGVEHSFLIRDHPVHCVPPSGGLIVTSVIRQGLVRGPGDEAGDAFRRHYGRHGAFLQANVSSPSEVPPGTAVWVDRSASSEIPPLPDPE
jgi:hypothetical protein